MGKNGVHALAEECMEYIKASTRLSFRVFSDAVFPPLLYSEMTTQENMYYSSVSHYPPGSAGATTSTLSLLVANEADPAMAAAVPSRVVSGTQSISNRTQQVR